MVSTLSDMISLIERLPSPIGSTCAPPSTCGLVEPDPPPHADVQTPANSRPISAPRRRRPSLTCPLTLALPIVTSLRRQPSGNPSSQHTSNSSAIARADRRCSGQRLSGPSVVVARYRRATSWFPFCRIVRRAAADFRRPRWAPPLLWFGRGWNEDKRWIRVFRSGHDRFAGLVGRLRQLPFEFGRRRAGSVRRVGSVRLRGSVRPRDAGDLLGGHRRRGLDGDGGRIQQPGRAGERRQLRGLPSGSLSPRAARR